jgi:uncharacterized membrane protein
MRVNRRTVLLSILAGVMAPIAAFAGGPLFIDPATGTPIAYRGRVRIYTDLGSLGALSNAAADAKTALAIQQWIDVPTSSFDAGIVGDVSSIGLADVTAANAGEVIGTNNGGGIHVIYDADGTLMSDFFGAPPSVLGIASPEIGVDGTNEIVESWVVLNGGAIDPADTDGSAFAGVITHEFGHSINLGHSQVNGSKFFLADPTGPAGCDALPYAGAPTTSDLETMYPFIDQFVTGSGAAQATVDMSDDVASISNIYPAPGWPASAGTITGIVTAADGVSQVSGINVVARNVANPWRDAQSSMSGDATRADASARGRYTFNGLTPGASYVVYVDGIVAGGFSWPPSVVFPGPEEFYNGAAESGNALTDSPCDAEPIVATAGSTVTANIAFNADPTAPKLTILGPNTVPLDITADGATVVGILSDYVGAPSFKWTASGGVENLGGAGSTISIAPNGSAIASNTFLEDGFQVASLFQSGTSWTQLPGLAGSCDGAEPVTKTVAFGVSNQGRSVVGLGFQGEHCGEPRAFRWDAATNQTTALEVTDDTRVSRANGISADGRVVWGFKEGPTGFREAAIWIDGRINVLSVGEDLIGEAYNASPDGKYVVGGVAGIMGEAWRWSARRGLERIGGLPDTFFSSAFAVSANGKVITGRSEGLFAIDPFIWTPRLGIMNLRAFLETQGTYLDPSALLYSPNSMSADGRRIAGVGGSNFGTFGWVLDITSVKVCHSPRGNPGGMRTKEVAFPEGLDAHLAHGDTLGACGDGK